jgi:hypothetical protein
VPCTDCKGVFLCQRFEILIVPLNPDEAVSGRFAERKAELGARDRTCNRFGDILHGLDEMRLPEDHVYVAGLFYPDSQKADWFTHRHHVMVEMGAFSNKWFIVPRKRERRAKDTVRKSQRDFLSLLWCRSLCARASYAGPAGVFLHKMVSMYDTEMILFIIATAERKNPPKKHINPDNAEMKKGLWQHEQPVP